MCITDNVSKLIKEIKSSKDIENIDSILCFGDLGVKIKNLLSESETLIKQVKKEEKFNHVYGVFFDMVMCAGGEDELKIAKDLGLM